mmetsp:Transcript_17733/g.53386  ORF Transcript_17733/g.53386 Transcript_17733/m.53386 type:complete len:220 (-) Transcript_17733:82-741(-)
MLDLVVMSAHPSSPKGLMASPRKRSCSAFSSPFGTFKRIMNRPGVRFLRWNRPAHFRRTSMSSIARSSQVVLPSRMSSPISWTSVHIRLPSFFTFSFSTLLAFFSRAFSRAISPMYFRPDTSMSTSSSPFSASAAFTSSDSGAVPKDFSIGAAMAEGGVARRMWGAEGRTHRIDCPATLCDCPSCIAAIPRAKQSPDGAEVHTQSLLCCVLADNRTSSE